jgi:hypothetical protein
MLLNLYKWFCFWIDDEGRQNSEGIVQANETVLLDCQHYLDLVALRRYYLERSLHP